MSVIKINKSDEKIIKDYSTYKGVGLVKVLAVNPTLAELQAIGLNYNNEPEYKSQTDTGEAKIRLDFIVGNSKLKTKHTFFLEDRERSNNAGDKFEFINNYGQTSWGTTLEEVVNRKGRNGNTWYKKEGARKAYVGEGDLIQFLSDWLNVNPDDQVYIENMDKIFTGDVSELRQYVKAAADNEIYLLFTVRENEGKYYQNTYNRFFTRASFTPQAAIARFAKEVKKQEDAGYPIKGFEGLEFGTFVPQLDSGTPDVDAPESDTKVEDLF